MSSASLNKVTLIGNLGSDPEIRSLPNGGKVATLSIATSETWNDRESGEKQDRTQWHKVVIYNEPLIDAVVQKHLHTGSRIYLEGSLENRKWDDKGATRYATEIVLRPYNGELKMLDSPKPAPEPSKPAARKAPAAQHRPAA
jgi:single-strand DNA-binding protein